MQDTDFVPPPAYPTLTESWGALGWLMLLNIIVGIIVGIGNGIIDYKLDMAQLLAVSGLATSLTVFWLQRRAGPGRWLPLRWVGPHERWPAYALLLLIGPAEVLTLSVQQRLHLPNLLAGKTLAQVPTYPWLSLGLMGVVIPAAEEALFRGGC